MTLTHRLISAGFAVAALASASVPSLAWTVWPDVDFAWYADAGRTAAPSIETFPAPRPGYIWSPAHYERDGNRQRRVEGQWIKDDYAEQVALYNQGVARTQEALIVPEGEIVGTARTTPLDRAGNMIPANPDASPIDSSRR